MIKSLTLTFFALTASSSIWAATVVHNQVSTDVNSGAFLSSSGGTIAAGGISIGYFTGAAMSDSAIQALSPATAFSNLIANGFKDLRSQSGATAAGAVPADFDWNFNNGALTGSNLGDIGGTLAFTVGASPNVPANTQLYIFAFDAGSFVGANPSSSFAGATSWAAVKDTSAFLAPASDLNSRNLRLASAIGPTEVLVGVDDSQNIRLAAIPEPSRALLGMIGLGALFIRRRR